MAEISNQSDIKTRKSPNFKIGVITAIITVIAISTQPIISEKRPDVLYPVIYAIATVLFENILIFPLALKHTLNQRKNPSGQLKFTIKKHWWRFLTVGIVFALSQIMFFYGFDSSGESAAISGSIAMKSSIIFTIIIGWIFLKEKASIIQIIFTAVILVALVYTLTLGSFRVEEMNIGTLVLFLMPLLWTVGHSVTKPILQQGLVKPSQVIFIRTLIGMVLLFSVWLCTYSISDLVLFLDWSNLLYMFLIGLSYVIGHYGWYSSIKHIDLALSSAIQAPQPILTSFFAWWILNEPIKFYHYIGLAVIFTSILIILYDKNRLERKINNKKLATTD
ncbi:MAG: DMT family transporter [Candidatus Lokiarchaeota archaeon]|nr:DMT family transporter [Candidatus Lokiarchaeota archaeon]